MSVLDKKLKCYTMVWDFSVVALNRRQVMEITFGMIYRQMVGLFTLLLIGYWMNRSRKLPKETEDVLAQLSTKLFLPALLFFTFLEECTLESLMINNRWILYGTLFTVSSILIAVLLARPMARGASYIEKVYRYALVFPNAGGFAMPIIMILWGNEVFFQYQLFMLPVNIFCYSWGVAQLIPNGHQNLHESLENFCNPVFIATILGMVFGVTGIKEYLPEFLYNSIQNLSNCYTPVTLILTGFVIGDYHVKEILENGMSYVFAALRLLIIPGVFLFVLRLLHAPDILCVIVCLVYACPCGMNTVVYPAAYGEDTCPGASLVLITSTLSVFSIPFLYTMI